MRWARNNGNVLYGQQRNEIELLDLLLIRTAQQEPLDVTSGGGFAAASQWRKPAVDRSSALTVSGEAGDVPAPNRGLARYPLEP